MPIRHLLSRSLSGLGLVAALVAGLGFTARLRAQDDAVAPKAQAAKAAGAAAAAPRQFPTAAEVSAAVAVVTDFLLADGVDAKLKFVRFPGKIAPLARAWYATHPGAPVRSTRDEVATSLTKLIHVGDMEFIVLTLQLLPDLQYKFFAVESTRAGLKLDWETAVGWQPMPLDELRKAPPSSPQPFRMHVGPGDYYNGPYADESKWLCCHLTYPGDDGLRFFGYADRSSAIGKRLADHFAAKKSISAILGIAGGRAGCEPTQVAIQSILSEEWFLKDGPATTGLLESK